MSTADLNNRAQSSNNGGGTVFVYPNDLGNLAVNDYLHYVVFNIYVRSQPLTVATNVEGATTTTLGVDPAGNKQSSNVAALSGGAAKSNESIVLYLPPAIVAEYAPQWTNQELGIVGAALQGGTNMIEKFKGGDAANQDWASIVKPVGKGIALTAAQAADQFIPGAKGAVEKGLGAILNPYSEVTFTGVTNRQFAFNFKFLPRSKQEAATVRSIIKMFKYHSAPAIENSFVMTYPSEFGISFWRIDPRTGASTENENLFKMDLCACTQVQVNYAPTGNMRAFEDGMPSEIDLTVGFTEMTIMTKSKILAGY